MEPTTVANVSDRGGAVVLRLVSGLVLFWHGLWLMALAFVIVADVPFTSRLVVGLVGLTFAVLAFQARVIIASETVEVC